MASSAVSAVQGEHPKCKTCDLGMLCLTGVVNDYIERNSTFCRNCRGIFVYGLTTLVVCRLVPIRVSRHSNHCSGCTFLIGTSVYGVTKWDIPSSAELIRGFYEKRKAKRRAIHGFVAEDTEHSR